MRQSVTPLDICSPRLSERTRIWRAIPPSMRIASSAADQQRRVKWARAPSLGARATSSTFDDVDDLAGVRIDDQDLITHHDVIVTAELRHDPHDVRRQRREVDAARNPHAATQVEIDPVETIDRRPMQDGVADLGALT